jgi:hypothetical protein
MKENTGVDITPGFAHLPTGHTVPIRQPEYRHTPYDEHYGSNLHADIPLKNRKIPATLTVGQIGRAKEKGHKATVRAAPWGLYSGGKIRTEGDRIGLDEEGAKEHVDKVLRDRPGANPHPGDVIGEEEDRKRTMDVLRKYGIDTDKASGRKDHFLDGSTSHLKVGSTSSGPLINPRYFNLHTGEFDD